MADGGPGHPGTVPPADLALAIFLLSPPRRRRFQRDGLPLRRRKLRRPRLPTLRCPQLAERLGVLVLRLLDQLAAGQLLHGAESRCDTLILGAFALACSCRHGGEYAADRAPRLRLSAMRQR